MNQCASTWDVCRILWVNPEGIKHFKVSCLHLDDVIDRASFRRHHSLGKSVNRNLLHCECWIGMCSGRRCNNSTIIQILSFGLLTPVGSRVHWPSTQNLYWCSPSGRSTIATKFFWLGLRNSHRLKTQFMGLRPCWAFCMCYTTFCWVGSWWPSC